MVDVVRAQSAEALIPAQAPAWRFFIKTYGCQMNVYDSQRLKDLLLGLGCSVATGPEDANLVILNTCHIREKASEKLYSDLGRLRKIKDARVARGEAYVIAVMGCVAQAEAAEIFRRSNVADIVVGPQSYHRLPQLLREHCGEGSTRLAVDFDTIAKFDTLAGLTCNTGSTGYVTIQEGCDKFCSFCVVPYTRGKEVSRPFAHILDEAQALVDRGVVSLTLLGQNVSAYQAHDAKGRKVRLADLLMRLGEIEGLARLSFTTSHPRDMDADLIAAFAGCKPLLPYMHLPVQSGDDAMLKAMNRGHDTAHYVEIVAALRKARPDLALSGDFIVGFPGESEAAFANTLKLAQSLEYAQAYAFIYSRRPGTPASIMRTQVAESEKKTRLHRLQQVLAKSRLAFNRASVGRTLDALIESPDKSGKGLRAKSPYMQSIILRTTDVPLRTMRRVVIHEATENALYGALEDG